MVCPLPAFEAKVGSSDLAWCILVPFHSFVWQATFHAYLARTDSVLVTGWQGPPPWVHPSPEGIMFPMCPACGPLWAEGVLRSGTCRQPASQPTSSPQDPGGGAGQGEGGGLEKGCPAGAPGCCLRSGVVEEAPGSGCGGAGKGRGKGKAGVQGEGFPV